MAGGLPSLTLVGLPETAVKESKDRVRSAILNSALQYPAAVSPQPRTSRPAQGRRAV
jgi:predicted ATPase with chaperone activity